MPDELSAAQPPVPPFDLVHRVMAIDREGADEIYRAHGRGVKEAIEWLLPPAWTFDGKRVLEFGCGAGRVMSAFIAEARRCEFHGCDIDTTSIEWMQANLVPPFHVFATSAVSEALPFEDGSVDLIYAVSVFSHLADDWSGWLAELHRCLSSSGLLLVSLLGEASSEPIAGEHWDPERVGMNVLFPEQSWDRGGPMVFISRWWLEARWGRAFRLEHFVAAEQPGHQDWAVLTKKPVKATAALFEEPEAGDGRELKALRHNVSQLRRGLETHAATERDLQVELARMKGSLSWRLTKPLRAIKRMVSPASR